PGLRRSSSSCTSFSVKRMPGGQPSTTQPSAGPWLSPQVVTRNRWPNVLCDITTPWLPTRPPVLLYRRFEQGSNGSPGTIDAAFRPMLHFRHNPVLTARPGQIDKKDKKDGGENDADDSGGHGGPSDALGLCDGRGSR